MRAPAKISEAEAEYFEMRRMSGPFQVMEGLVSMYSWILPFESWTFTTGPMGMKRPVREMAWSRRPPPLVRRSRMRPDMPSFLSFSINSWTSEVVAGSLESEELGP